MVVPIICMFAQVGIQMEKLQHNQVLSFVF